MTRIKDDRYFTDERLGAELLNRLPRYGYSESLGVVLEPAAGSGQLAALLAKQAGRVVTNDIDENIIEPSIYEKPLDFNLDAAQSSSWVKFRELGRYSGTPFDWTITNPPYKGKVLMPLLENALVFSKKVAVLLRVSFLEPTTHRNPRQSFLEMNADQLRAIMPVGGPRPSFTGDGKTDSVTVAWFLFDSQWSWSYENIPCPFDFISDWKATAPSKRKRKKGYR